MVLGKISRSGNVRCALLVEQTPKSYPHVVWVVLGRFIHRFNRDWAIDIWGCGVHIVYCLIKHMGGGAIGGSNNQQKTHINETTKHVKTHTQTRTAVKLKTDGRLARSVVG